MISRVALAAMLLSGAAACGDNDTTAGATTEEFLAEANAVCAAGRAEIDTRMAELGDDPTEEELAGAVDYIVDNVMQQIADHRALDVPDDLQDEMQGIWTDLTEIMDDMRAQGPSVFEGENPINVLSPRLASIGLTDCA